ncbi:MAG: hypothetical protein ACI840_001612 [Ulvibacter sp.]|jgi:hypothetical protein
MLRKIVDFKKLTPEILILLVEKYPDGYGDGDVIEFKNLKNETIEAVEVRTEDSIYLVKISSRLVNSMANFVEDDYDDAEFTEPISEMPDKEKLNPAENDEGNDINFDD